MARKDIRFFIRVPGPGGSEQYVAVDPGKLAIDMLTQLYVSSNDSQGKAVGQANGYFPVPSNWTPAVPDLKGLMAALREVLSTGTNQLEGYANGALLAGALGSQELWQKLFEQINLGQTTLAEATLTELLWEIIGSAVSAAAEFDRLAVIAAGHEAHATVVSAVLETEAKHLAEHYLAWGVAADRLLVCLQRLNGLKTRAQRLLQDLELGLLPRRSLAKMTAEFGAMLTNFNAEAKAVLFDTGGQAPETAAVLTGIAKLSELEKQAQQAWDATREYFSQEASEISALLANLAAEFGGAQVRLQIFEEQHQSTTEVRPWQFNPNIISQADYEIALAASTRPWQDFAQEVVQIVNNGRALLSGRPAVDAELTKAMEMAERYIPLLEERDEDPVLDLTLEQPAPSPTVAFSVAPAQVTTIPTANLVRQNELYEMLVAVAYVKTCNAKTIMGSNIKNMLKLLFLLGKVTEAEAADHPSLSALVEQANQVTWLQDGTSISEGWRTISTHFMAYESQDGLRRHKKLKLTQSAQNFGQAMMQKYGLTVESVKAAYQLFTEQNNREYAEKAARRRAAKES